MKNLPGGKTTYDAAYELNESGNCGFYPVGQNNCWHSGVHFDLSSNNGIYPVYPLIKGEIIAYRSTDAYEIEYPEEVGLSDYNDLPNDIKEYYRLYTTDESLEKSILQIYKVKDTRPVRKLTNNFVLLKHSIIGHGYKNNNLNTFDIDFFTLYTNLRPFNNYKIKSDYNNFTNISVNNHEVSPIFADWIFKVAEPQDNRIYKTNMSDKIFPLSHFKDTRNTSFYPTDNVNYYEAKFENEPDKVINVPKIHCDILSDKVLIKSKNREIKFYRDDISVLSENIQEVIGTLNKNSIFEIADTSTNQWASGNNYVKVKLNRDMVESRIFEGWIDTTKCFIHDKFNPTIYYRENEAKTKRILYKIDKDTFRNSNSSAFKIVTFYEYMDKVYGTTLIDKNTVLGKVGNIITNIPENMITSKTPAFRSADDTNPYITAAQNEFVIVLNSENHLRDSSSDIIYNISYGFYLNQNKTNVYKVNKNKFDEMKSFYDPVNITQINNFNRINPEIQLPNEIDEVMNNNLTVLKFTKDRELFSDDWYVKISPPSNEIDDFKQIENLEYCKFYIVGYLNTTWMVKADDFTLHSGKVCRIKNNAEDNCYRIASERESGIMVYSNSGLDENGIPIGNAKSILILNTEFKTDNSKDIIDNGKVNSFYKLKNTNTEGYIYLKHTRFLNAKIIENDDYPLDDNIKKVSKDISFQDIIGYGNIDKPGTQTQEVSLFFKELPDIDNNMELNRYIVNDNTNIYESEEYIAQKVFFPPLSILSVNETKQINGRTAIKCLLSTLVLHFRDSEVKELLTVDERKNESIAENDTNRYFKIIQEPSTIWFYSYSITKETDGNNAIKLLVDKFKDYWDELEGSVFKFAYKGGGNTTALNVNLLNIENKFETWLLCEELSSHGRLDNDKKIVTFGWMGQNQNTRQEGIETYTDCPAYKKVKPIDRITVWEGTLYSDIGIVNSFTALEGNREVKYLGIKIKERVCYIKEDEIDNCKDNLLDLNKQFTISDRDTDNDLFCDIKEEVLDIIETDSNTADGIISNGELKNLFEKRNQTGYKETVEKLRKLILKHPLEFNKDLYQNIEEKLNSKKLDTSNESMDLIKTEAEKLCIWSGIKDITGIDNQLNLWFAHPISFIKHLEKMKALDYNPYLNKSITVEKDDYINVARTQSNIVDNPGFSPIVYGNDYSWGDIYYEGQKLGCFTGLFNQPRFSTWYRHGGVDIATFGKNAPIISFIHGTVWACTWDKTTERNVPNSGYGKVMIIKSKTEGKLYLLGHLHSFLKDVGDEIVPGDEVALTGSTGWSSGEHLHLEVRLCDVNSVFKQIMNETKNKYPGTGEGLAWNQQLVIDKKIPERINPFDHTEKYGDWKW